MRKVYAISDLHLSGENTVKPMDIFTSYTTGYLDEIVNNWTKIVENDDIVLICGDISWATYLSKAQYDLDFIGHLKGTKILMRGNHDYWWKSISGVRAALCENTFAIQNDSLRFDNIIFCGTRGWTIPEETVEMNENDIKLYNREIERLRISLETGVKDRKDGDILICMMHFPPLNSVSVDESFLKLFNEFNVNKVVFGHLHGSHINTPLYQVKDNIEYYLTSCDQTKNNLVRIL